jgi:hypothetical protein
MEQDTYEVGTVAHKRARKKLVSQTVPSIKIRARELVSPSQSR